MPALLIACRYRYPPGGYLVTKTTDWPGPAAGRRSWPPELTAAEGG